MAERSKPTELPSGQANTPVKIAFLSLAFCYFFCLFVFGGQTSFVWVCSPSDPSDALGFSLIAQSDAEVANFGRIPTSILIPDSVMCPRVRLRCAKTSSKFCGNSFFSRVCLE